MHDEYGIDWNGPTGVDHETVVIPATETPLSPTHTVTPAEVHSKPGISL